MQATTTSAHVCTTTSTLAAGPANTTRRGYLADAWLPSYRRECIAADRLRHLAGKIKDGPDKDALWAGYCAVLNESRETVKHATQVGGLPLLWDGSTALKGGKA